jgi:hypothetical protein
MGESTVFLGFLDLGSERDVEKEKIRSLLRGET